MFPIIMDSVGEVKPANTDDYKNTNTAISVDIGGYFESSEKFSSLLLLVALIALLHQLHR